MSSQPILPFETIETIIDTLAQDDPGSLSLKACSLVCQGFLELCRKHIFASITIDCLAVAVPTPTSAAFVRLLSTTPQIADHIRELDWNILVEDFEDRSLPGILEKITKLQSLTIYWPRGHLQWRTTSLRAGILHLLHLPTLIRLEICDSRDFVFIDLIPCINLREIRLDCTQVVEAENPFPLTLPNNPLQLDRLLFGVESSAAISRIGTSLRPDGRPIFNLAVLSCISLVLYNYDEFEASRQLFQHCVQLTNVDILVNFPLTWTGIAKILEPSIKTLAHLCFSMSAQDETGTSDPLAGLVAELEEIRCHRNVIENMTIDVLVGACYKCNQGDDWGLLDSVLTQSGWSRLARVSLAISTWNLYHDDATLTTLPQRQLPRLLSSKSTVFEFSVIDKSYG